MVRYLIMERNAQEELLPAFTWRDAHFLVVDSTKVIGVRKPYSIGYLRYIHGGVLQEVSGFLQPDIPNELYWGQVGKCLQLSIPVSVAQLHGSTKIVDRKVRIVQLISYTLFQGFQSSSNFISLLVMGRKKVNKLP